MDRNNKSQLEKKFMWDKSTTIQKPYRILGMMNKEDMQNYCIYNKFGTFSNYSKKKHRRT